MTKYRIVFKCKETGRTHTYIITAPGICPAIEGAIRKEWTSKPHDGYYEVIKAEEVEE